MKKLISLVIPLIILWAVSPANIAPPRVCVNEIVFDSQGNWTVETLLYSYLPQDIDSLRIVSSSGSSLIIFYTMIPFGDTLFPEWISVIGDTNLAVPLSVSPAGDYVKLITYSDWNVATDSIAFGNYPGSYLDCQEEGESYAFVSFQQSSGWAGSFAIDRTPTIGMVNDTAGAVATLSGWVYDPDGELITEGWFPFVVYNLIINIQPDGSYSECVFSRRYFCDEIAIRYPPWPNTTISYYIEPLDFCLRPDTSFQADFITTGYVGADEMDKNYDHVLIVSPNPFHSSLTFYLDADELPRAENLLLTITDSYGKRVHESRLEADGQRHDWVPGPAMPAGIYIYSLSGDGRVYTSGIVIKR